ILSERLGLWIPELFKPKAKKTNRPLSATNIKEDDVDRFSWENEMLHFLTIKEIRDDLYGPRRMFQDPNILRVDRARGLKPVSIDLPRYPDLQITIPRKEPDPVEFLLRNALKVVGG
ncbi:MAG: hypothetical protein HY381_01375, partial [Candidatus Chisholmbacteria bacterium]|nr:hypothetical protein [Candidatus Chisholmbacteria bacterium]